MPFSPAPLMPPTHRSTRRARTVQKCTTMNTAASRHTDTLLLFPLEGLYPPRQTLVVNPLLRTATVFAAGVHNEAHLIAQQHFSPNSMRLLIPLLRAYPAYCPYDILLAHLFTLSLEEANLHLHGSWERAIRPVRRTVGGLATLLQPLGLTVCNIRGVGYLLEAPLRHPD